MDEQRPVEQQSEEQRLEERRQFLKKAGKTAVVAPAVALLLSATKASADGVTSAEVVEC